MFTLPPPRAYKPQELSNFARGCIGGFESGAYKYLHAGTDYGKPNVYDGYMITDHASIHKVDVLIDGEHRDIKPIANFERLMTKRLMLFVAYCEQFQMWLQAQPRALKKATIRKFIEELHKQWQEVEFAFERGYPEPARVKTGDPSNDYRLAKGFKTLDQIRNLADQDQYKYTAFHIMDVAGIINGQIEQLRDRFDR